MQFSIGLKLSLLGAVICAVLVIVGITAYRNITTMVENAEAVRHTYMVIDVNDDIPNLLNEAESTERGYLLTGNPELLTRFSSLKKRISTQYAELKKLVKVERAKKLLVDMEPLLEQRLAGLDETITIYKTKGFEEARDYVKLGSGVKLMDQVLKIHDDIDTSEHDLATKRSEDLTDSSRLTLNLVLSGMILALTLTLLGVVLLTRNICRPLINLTVVAEAISHGDLTTRPQESEGRKDEVGQLARAFTNMYDYLRDMSRIAQTVAGNDLTVSCTPISERDALGTALATMIANFRTLGREVQDASRLISGTAAQIAAMTAQLAASSAETAAAVSETSTTVEEIKVTAQLVNQKSAFVSECARDTSQATQNGHRAVEETIQGMTKIRQQMDFIAESIVKLSEQSMAIGEIISSVGDLASQSNLLAVNASIEAAKAGEQGKGFAVVAQEVRSLAEQSKDATGEIRRILNDIQKAISSAVMATEQGGKTVEVSVRQSTDTEGSIRLIEQGASGTVQAAAQILASTNEQVAGLNQVALAMENIRGASEQIVQSTRQTDEATANLNELGRKLWKVVENLKVS